MHMSKKSTFVVLTATVVMVFVALLVPPLLRSRSKPSTVPCVAQLKVIDGAKQQWAAENHKATNDVPTWDDLRPYFGSFGTRLTCPAGGSYTIGPVGEDPRCSIGGPSHTL